MRLTLQELAAARADAQRMLAGHAHPDPLSVLRVFLRATAPLTKDEALPVMIANANESGGWEPRDTDLAHANEAFTKTEDFGNWQNSIRAQWATLIHFMGGAE